MRILWIFFTLIVYSQCINAQEFDYDTAVKNAQVGDSLLNNVRGKLVYGEGDGRRAVYYTYERTSGRLLITVENLSDKKTFARWSKLYDGEKTTTLTYNIDKRGLLSPTAFYDNDKLEYTFAPFVFGYFLFREDISKILSSKKIMLSGQYVEGLKYSKTERSEGLDVDVFSIFLNGNEALSLYLARQYLYRPVKMVLNDEDGNSVFMFTCMYKEIDTGLYFPDKVYIEENGIESLVLDYIIEETTVNTLLKNEDFILDIPKGLSVSDIR